MSRVRTAHPRIPSNAIAAGCAALALCTAWSAAPARSQEATRVAAADAAAPSRDRVLLAALGLDLAVIEQTGEVPRLWRAVRELVLPGKVSEATQQRILRRVWQADPDIRRGSHVDSQAN
jgi:hypothetical protein